jgi:hypothetical protein
MVQDVAGVHGVLFSLNTVAGAHRRLKTLKPFLLGRHIPIQLRLAVDKAGVPFESAICKRPLRRSN